MKIKDVIKGAMSGGVLRPGGAIGGAIMAAHERKERKHEVKSAVQKALEEERKRHALGHSQRSEHGKY